MPLGLLYGFQLSLGAYKTEQTSELTPKHLGYEGLLR